VKYLGYPGVPGLGFVGLKKHFRGKPKMQLAWRNDLQPIVIQRHRHRARRTGVIPMNEGVGQCLAQGFGGQGRGVDTGHLAGHNFASHGDRQ